MLHDDIRWLPWLVELGLLVAIARPFGTLRRVQLSLTTLLALLVVSNIKLRRSEIESFSEANGAGGRAEGFGDFIDTSMCQAVNAFDRR